jgi:hypothetical protein
MAGARVRDLFTKLTATGKVAIFSWLALCMAVGNTLSHRMLDLLQNTLTSTEKIAFASNRVTRQPNG